MFSGKIHRATVTEADLHYEGSITLDEHLMEASGIVEYEMVHIWNVTRGTRLTTYALKGDRHSGVICVNGAAAHQNAVGDLVIIAAFVELEEEECKNHKPKIVRVDEQNRILSMAAEQAGPLPPLSVLRS